MIPAFLSEFVRAVIIMSITGGAVCLLLLAVKPIARHRLPKSAQYFFWLVVLGAFVVPVSAIVTLPARVPDVAPLHSVVESNVISIQEHDVLFVASQRQLAQAQIPASALGVPPEASAEWVTMDIPSPSYFTIFSTLFMAVYPFGVIAVLFYNLLGYGIFVKKLRRGLVPAREEAPMLAELCKGRQPRLMRGPFAATPMLIGLLRPVIILPDREYSNEQLHGILLHELTHMRRGDLAVKWLSLAACALHWFNPLVWLARREIDRACELACDEAVIRNMDASGKQNYGETLIAAASSRKIPMPVVSTTMCAEKRAIKERLSAIMKSKKYTKAATAVSALILLAGVLTACALGAARGEEDYPQQEVVSAYVDNGNDTPDLTAEDDYPQQEVIYADVDNGNDTPDLTAEDERGFWWPEGELFEELGEIIVASGNFWTEWWFAEGRFAYQHLGDWGSFHDNLYMELLPSSGFSGINDVRDYLLNYYTEAWVDSHLHSEFPPFVEYNNTLYVHMGRMSRARAQWETSTHTVYSRRGVRYITTESTVLHHDAETSSAFEVTHRILFYDGRISATSICPVWGLWLAESPEPTRASVLNFTIPVIELGEAHAVARIIMRGDTAYVIEITSEYGQGAFVGLKDYYADTVTPSGQWFYSTFRSDGNPVSVNIPFMQGQSNLPVGVYYLYVGSAREQLRNVHISITGTGSAPDIELLIFPPVSQLVTVHASDLPEGFAGFSLTLPDMYALSAWVEDGVLHVPHYRGHSLLQITQLPDVPSAEAWVYYTLERYYFMQRAIYPTAEFPFHMFISEAALAEDGQEQRVFVRDNGKGGIFVITVLSTPAEWHERHGVHLMSALAGLETHTDI